MIPKEILAVERPKNTVVRNQYGKYAVIARTCVRAGKKNMPVDLGKVGEIVDGKFVPEISPNLKDAERARSEKKARMSGEKPAGKPGRPAKDAGDVPDIKKWGACTFYHRTCREVLDELAGCFDLDTAKSLYAMGILRAVDPGLTDRDMQWEYKMSFVSEYVPGLHLSESAVPALLSRVGAKYNSIMGFMRRRVSKYAGDGLVAIDGKLDNYESEGSVFSAYSHKAKQKCRREISTLLAFNAKTGMLICSKTYIGSAPDSSTTRDFMREVGLSEDKTAFLITDDVSDPGLSEEGVFWDDAEELSEKSAGIGGCVYDRGCNTAELARTLAEKGIAYIAPLKRNSRLAEKYGMWDPVAPLHGYEDTCIQFRKCKTEEGGYLYSFRNPIMEAREKAGYLERERERENEVNARYYAALDEARKAATAQVVRETERNGGDKDAPADQARVDEIVSQMSLPEKYEFDEAKYRDAIRKFGVIVFICPLDVAPILVYLAYQNRWSLEVEIDMYRNILVSDAVRVHDDLRVIATEFINTISQIMGSMVKRRMMDLGLFQKYTQPQMMKAMSYIWKRRMQDGTWSGILYTNKGVEKIVTELGLDA